MSDGINKVFLFGNLGAEPELKTTSAGAVLKFRLATTHSWLDKESNAKQEKTEWHSVTVFGKRGEGLAKILHKGSRIFVEGRISTHSYDKDGQKKYFTEVIAEDISLGGGRSNGAYVPPTSTSQSALPAPF